MAGEFEELYTSAFGRLVGQLFLVTGDLHEAEEVVQEAFTRAAGRWQRLRDHDLPEQWVRRVAINLATDGRRRVRRRLAVLAQLDAEAVVPPISVDGLAVAAALATLPRRHRQVVVLHYLLDLPVPEVARQLAVPVGTVKSRLARARTALAAQLDTEIDQVRSRHGHG